jgi:hypothetical protein
MAATAFDSKGRRHYAMTWADHKVNYRAPGADKYYAVDVNSYAIGPTSIAISSDDMIVLTYVNGNHRLCTYERPVEPDNPDQDWGWSDHGGNALLYDQPKTYRNYARPSNPGYRGATDFAGCGHCTFHSGYNLASDAKSWLPLGDTRHGPDHGEVYARREAQDQPKS